MRSPAVDETYRARLWDHTDAVLHAPTFFPLSPVRMPVVPQVAQIGVVSVIDAKLSLLRGLREGWSGPESRAPSTEAISHFEAFLSRLGRDVNLRAEPVANADGAIEIEWKAGGAERVIEFTKDGLWLYESRDGEVWEETLDRFDVDRALSFFNGESY
jgi:hypothetical protein